jgi:hypothetical protein
MKPSQIIAADLEKSHQNPHEAMRAIAALTKHGTGILLHENNSVIFVVHIGTKSVEIHIFTQDKPFTFMRSLREFINKIRDSGVKNIYGFNETKETLNLFKKYGVKIKESDKPKYQWMGEL